MDTMEKLARRAQKGDKDAFVELIERCKLSMSRVAVSILHNEEDAADAIAETVLTAFSKLCTLREPRYFKTWLTRVLIRNCCDILRSRRKSVSLDSLPEKALGEPEGMDRDWALDVRMTMAALGENDRLVLTLFYLDGLSVRDISGLLGVKENTVKTRLSRGRARFRGAYCEREERSCEASGK